MDIQNKSQATFIPQETIYFFNVINILIVFIIITILFTVVFRTLPDGKVVLRDCLIGASFTALLFMIGKFAIGAYLGRSSIATWYGAAGSVILILIWVYYSAIILYLGAEFTKVYANTHGQKIIPYEYSVKVIEKEIENETKQVKKVLKN